MVSGFVRLLDSACMAFWGGRDDGTAIVHYQDLAAGVVVALIGVAVIRPHRRGSERAGLSLTRLFWLFVYGVVLGGHIVAANVDVAYRVLHPAMPLRPGIVKVQTRLHSPTALAVLCNSITLTPGTLTVHAARDGTLYIHWINIVSTDIEQETERIIGRFEWLLRRVFE